MARSWRRIAWEIALLLALVLFSNVLFLSVMAPVQPFLTPAPAPMPVLHRIAPQRPPAATPEEAPPQSKESESPPPAADKDAKHAASGNEQHTGSAPASEKETQGVAPYVAKYKQLRTGMTYEEVTAIMGAESTPISGTLGTDKIVRWENPDKSFFAARFRDNRMERLTNLSFPPAGRESKPAEQSLAPSTAPSADPVTGDRTEGAAQKPVEAGEDTTQDVKKNTEAESQEDTEPSGEDASAQTRKSVLRIGDAKELAPRVHKARLPRFSQPISRGMHDVRIHNEGTSPVKVGLRMDTKRGKDLSIASGGEASVLLPVGSYTVYYLSSETPDTLLNGGSFTVDAPMDVIHVQLR